MKLPAHTCPDIDKIIARIQDVYDICDTGFEDDDTIEYANRRLLDIYSELIYIPNMLEELRNSNSELREAAEKYQAQYEEQESDNYDLRDQIRDLEYENRLLEDRVESLREQYE